MRRQIAVALTRLAPVLTAAGLTLAVAPTVVATSSPQLNIAGRHIVPVKGSFSPDISHDLLYNGGRVMRKTSKNYVIFWEPTNLQTGAPTHVSSGYNSLLERYFGDVGGNGLYNNNTQYYELVRGKQHKILNSSSLADSYVDTSPYPASGCVDRATPGNCVSDGQIQAEIQKVMALKGWKGNLPKIFYVFTSYGEGSCIEPGACAFIAYCAYHGNFSWQGQDVIYSNMPYVGTDLGGCGAPQSPNNDIDADSAINVTSHEHMESVTDPNLDAWYDVSKNEIGDKCSWNFGPLDYDGGKANEFWNGNFYIVQQEWDNAVSDCVQSGP